MSRRRFAAAALVACVVALIPDLATAQNQTSVPIQIPKALLFPNYDNVLLGKDQALEGGAYIARAGDASSNFYNPAGLVQSEKTSLNASSTGWSSRSRSCTPSRSSSEARRAASRVNDAAPSPCCHSRAARLSAAL